MPISTKLRSRHSRQINKDAELVRNGWGWTNTAHTRKADVSGGAWWFLTSSMTTLSGSNFFSRLFNAGQNVLLFIYKRRQDDGPYAHSDHYNEMTEAANSHDRRPQVYNYFPVDPFCPPQPEWIT